MSRLSALPDPFEGLRSARAGPRAAASSTVEWVVHFATAVLDAFAEGFRIIGREPKAAAIWFLFWVAAIASAAILAAIGPRVTPGDTMNGRTLAEFLDHRGPTAIPFVVILLLVWGVHTVAVYRAVLRPSERRWGYVRLGRDEVRMSVMTLALFGLVLVFGGAPAYLLLVVFNPLAEALPAFAREIAGVGALATVAIEVWLGVRLSLIAVETVAERRFHLTAYWPLVEGRFWYLLANYFLWFLLLFALLIPVFLIGGAISQAAVNLAMDDPSPRRVALLISAAVALTALTAAFWMLSLTVICACQAYAFRAIVGQGRSDVVIS